MEHISKFYSVNGKKFAEVLLENNNFIVKLYQITASSDEELVDILSFDNIKYAEDACEDFVLEN